MKYAIIAALLLLLYAAAENVFMLKIRREVFRSGGIRIAHIADLHKKRFGSGNERLCRKTAGEKPDIILISGDLVSRKCTDFTDAEKTLRRLAEIAPVYMVFGNHETDLPDAYREKFTEIIKNSGTVLLKNEASVLEIKGRSINLCGMELNKNVYKKDERYKNLDTVDCGDILRAMGEKPSGETILLVHNPLFAEAYEQWGADYAVSGHVHGGAARIPFIGVGILSPERRFFPEYSKGVYNIGRMKLLLSAGLGKLRLFNPPEIVIYDI